MRLYTKYGRPLQVFDNLVYSKSGKVVGKIEQFKVFGTDGKYVGTIYNNRLIYWLKDSNKNIPPFEAFDIPGSKKVNGFGVAVWGAEPDIPD